MYKNYQAFTKAASFFVACFLVYKYIVSLNCSYTDMSTTANRRPEPDEELWPDTTSSSNIRAHCHFITQQKFFNSLL